MEISESWITLKCWTIAKWSSFKLLFYLDFHQMTKGQLCLIKDKGNLCLTSFWCLHICFKLSKAAKTDKAIPLSLALSLSQFFQKVKNSIALSEYYSSSIYLYTCKHSSDINMLWSDLSWNNRSGWTQNLTSGIRSYHFFFFNISNLIF